MSTLPASTYNLGGAIVMPPQPDVLAFALRLDHFQTICDVEMSVARSLRDACTGAFLTGAVGMASVFLTIDWDESARKGRHPLAWTILLCTMTGVALVVGIVEWIRMRQTGTQSFYSRLIGNIRQYFNIQ